MNRESNLHFTQPCVFPLGCWNGSFHIGPITLNMNNNVTLDSCFATEIELESRINWLPMSNSQDYHSGPNRLPVHLSSNNIINVTEID